MCSFSIYRFRFCIDPLCCVEVGELRVNRVVGG